MTRAALLLGLPAGLLLCGGGVAHADANLSGSLTLASDYRIRGVSQNDRAPSPQVELDWAGPEGWSLGARAMKVNFADHAGTSLEADFVAGKTVTIDSVPFDLQATYYAYPDHRRARDVRYSMIELSALATWQWERWTATGFVAWSPDYFGETGPAWYGAAGLSYTIADWLSVSANAGVQEIAAFDRIPGTGLPYAHGDIGLAATSGPVSLDLRLVATSLSAAQCLRSQGGVRWCEPGVVATLSYAVGP